MGRYDGKFNGGNGNDFFRAKKKSFGPFGLIKRWGSWTLDGNGGNDTLIGGPKNDRIYGDSGSDYLKGDGGNDYISGGSGNDTLIGGTGNDYLSGGTGSDRMYGGTGNDTFIVNSSLDRVYESSYQGVDTVKSYVSYSLGRYVENLTLLGSAYRGSGNAYKNSIRGNNYRNSLLGYGGNDRLYGNGGNDSLSGGSGNDYLSGGSGNDYLSGGTGTDTLRGGSSSDRLNGYGGTSREYDILTGDSSFSKPNQRRSFDGADTFILGDRSKAFYQGLGFATITDFNRDEGDKLQLHGNHNDYSLGTSNRSGSNLLDTEIRYKGDLIGVVQDTTSVFLSTDVQFA